METTYRYGIISKEGDIRNRMRIALLLSGQPRFVKEVAPIIIANVIGDYNVDTFCHF